MKYPVFSAYLKKALADKGLSQETVAKLVGVTPQAVNQWCRGKTMPLRPTLAKLAALLGTTVEMLTSLDAGDVIQPANVSSLDPHTRSADAVPSNVEPAPQEGPVLGRADMPVFASAEGGDGEVLVTYEPIDYIRRPAFLEHVRDAFAMYVVNDSMSPRFEPGDLLLVNPGKPVRPRDDVLVVLSADGVEHRMLVKRLVKRTREKVVLQQFNPRGEFSLPADQVVQLLRVVGIYSD